ncbi:MAG: alpha/beta hydrolase [Acidimicrobiia bacterium]|nr:MAG: alpha/beta hydrolase [Acidimicrobiia bacterium]
MTETGTIEVSDGTKLFTRSWAPDDPKRDMLIVHGLAEHSGRWEHVAQFFVARGYAVTAYDLRGHGKSGGARVHVDSFDQMVGDLDTVADGVGRDRPWVLYAHSLGGLIATHYLISEHRKPDAAVLSAPALDDELPAILHAAAQVLGRVIPTLRLPNSIDGAQLSRDPAVGEAYFADPLVQTKATARFGLEGFNAQSSARDSLHEIKVPTLVIHGAEDRLVPPMASAPLAAVDGVERKLYPGVRHELHNEPEQGQVLSDVADWLDAALA